MNDANASVAEAKRAPDKVFVARQPIFDSEQKLFGYELLYRNSINNSYDGTDGTSATLAVVRRAFLILGTQLTGTSKAFINFNLDCWKRSFPSTLCPETTVIEILENVVVDSTAIEFARS